MKTLFTFIILCPILIFSQESIEKDLDSIFTKEAAETYLKKNKSNKGKLFVFNKEKHKTRLSDALFKLSKGGTKTYKTDYNTTYYKVIDKSETPHYRVSYIYFDGNELSISEINEKRQKIINQYNDGYKFSKLAKLHSMDNGAKRGGDLGWFSEGKMHSEFEEAVKKHEINSVFTLDISDRPWHYIILKTHDVKYIEEIEVLKVTETFN